MIDCHAVTIQLTEGVAPPRKDAVVVLHRLKTHFHTSSGKYKKSNF